MKVLHYLFGLPPVRVGGLPKYVIDLVHGEQELGIDASILIAGPISPIETKGASIRKWTNWDGIVCYRIKNPLYVPNSFGIKKVERFMKAVPISPYINWLRNMELDVIHIHGFMGLHREFLEAARNLDIPLIFTAHNYYGLCPKIDLLRNDRVCEGEDWNTCVTCNVNAYPISRLWLEQTGIYRWYTGSKYIKKFIHKINKKIYRQHDYKENIADSHKDMSGTSEYLALKDYFYSMFQKISFFIYNSEQTKDIYQSLLGNRANKVIPLINKTIKDNRKIRNYGKTLRLGYLGYLTHFKGYDILVSALTRLYEEGNTDFYLNIYTTFPEDIDKIFIKPHLPYDDNIVEKVFDDMDLLVVPSVCKETFGMVVLEALSFGVPVVISENVGAKSLIYKYPGTGVIFGLENDELYQVIHNVYHNRGMLKDMNRNILKHNIKLDFSQHIKEIIDIYELCL